MPNRLASSSSPYLRQHAENPVAWYPWGEEAFAALLKRHGARVGSSTRYPLGPFKLQEEMAWVKRHGGDLVVGDDRAIVASVRWRRIGLARRRNRG